MITRFNTIKVSFFLLLIIVPSLLVSTSSINDLTINNHWSTLPTFQSSNRNITISTSPTNSSHISPIHYKLSQTMSLRDSVGVSSLLARGFNGTGIKIGIVDTGEYANDTQFGNRVNNQKS